MPPTAAPMPAPSFEKITLPNAAREPFSKGKRAGQRNLSAKAPMPNFNKVPKRLLPFCCYAG